MSTAMGIQAVIFDMDGILIDSENLWQEAEKALFADLGIELTAAHLEQSRGLMSHEMVAHWCHSFALDVNRQELAARYNAIMLAAFQKKVPLMEGAREALDFFKNKKLPLALASCSPMSHIKAAMDLHGLTAYFDAMISCEDDMPGKPHPEIYLRIARTMGVNPATCLAIEDSFYGLISARSARMKVLSMPDPKERNQPRFSAADHIISSLTEINEPLYQKLAKF